MSVRTDVTINWNLSPRVLTVAAPSIEITCQEVVDTLRFLEDSVEGMNYPPLIDAAGKEPLGGGVEVGITATLQNVVVAFEARPGPDWILCKITGGNLVAVDENGDDLDPRLPTAYVSADRALSSSATTQNLNSINYSTFNGGVTVSFILGVSGTKFPTGTPEQPVNNWTDAFAIASVGGFDTFYLRDPYNVITNVDLSDKIVIGENETRKFMQISTGAIADGTSFKYAVISGAITGDCYFENCALTAITNFSGSADNCFITGDITINPNAVNPIRFYNSFSGEDATNTPMIDMNGTDQTLMFQEGRGQLQIGGSTNPTCQINIAADPLWIIMDVSNTEGTLNIIGVGHLDDNTNPLGNFVVNDQYFVDNSKIDAAAVWDENLSDHIVPGTYGLEIATKSDVQGSAATSQTIASSGTMIAGTDQTGDYTSTQVKDGVYWIVEELTGVGLTMEFTFNIPEGDKAGQINLYGKYTGKPAGSHYMELWAWNVDSSSFELITEAYILGGDIGLDTFSAAYYERHIDRTNNEEVKIRLVHSIVSPYINSHEMWVDYIEATSIEVLTSQFIADAVWDEELTGHDGPASAGLSMQTQDYNGMIVYDTVNGIGGTLWPIGTHRFPSNNLADSITLAETFNVDHIRTHSDLTIGAGQDVRKFRIDTQGIMNTNVVIESTSLVDSSAYYNVNISGELGGTEQILIQDCSVGTLLNFTGVMNTVSYLSGMTLEISQWATVIQGTAGGDAATGMTLKLNGGLANFSHFAGYMTITDKTGASLSTIACAGADIVIDASCVNGTIHLNGVGHLVADNSGAGCTVVNDMTNPNTVTTAVWNADEAKRLLGLSHENAHIDQPNYDTDGNLISARVRIYSDAVSVGTNSNVIATYNITAPSTGPGIFTTWSQKKA